MYNLLAKDNWQSWRDDMMLVTPFYFLCLILSGAHYRLVLIFRIYLVLPAFAAYRTSVLTRDYRDLDT